jgi:hypothetical protein
VWKFCSGRSARNARGGRKESIRATPWDWASIEMKIEEGDIQFLEILHDILENPLYSKILEWNQENIFEIKNIDLFASVRKIYDAIRVYLSLAHSLSVSLHRSSYEDFTNIKVMKPFSLNLTSFISQRFKRLQLHSSSHILTSGNPIAHS